MSEVFRASLKPTTTNKPHLYFIIPFMSGLQHEPGPEQLKWTVFNTHPIHWLVNLYLSVFLSGFPFSWRHCVSTQKTSCNLLSSIVLPTLQTPYSWGLCKTHREETKQIQLLLREPETAVEFKWGISSTRVLRIKELCTNKHDAHTHGRGVKVEKDLPVGLQRGVFCLSWCWYKAAITLLLPRCPCSDTALCILDVTFIIVVFLLVQLGFPKTNLVGGGHQGHWSLIHGKIKASTSPLFTLYTHHKDLTHDGLWMVHQTLRILVSLNQEAAVQIKSTTDLPRYY